MSDRPSDGMDIDELRDEFDWITEFQSRMAERIRGDADVHNLVDYVGKLEAENAKLRELCKDIYDETVSGCYGCLSLEHVKHPSKCDNGICEYKRIVDRIRELGIEVD